MNSLDLKINIPEGYEKRDRLPIPDDVSGLEYTTWEGNKYTFESKEQLLKVQKILNENNIFPRRYFYPSLDTLEYIEPKQECHISRDISKRILCLPIYPDLDQKVQNKIIKIVKENI
jgi:dTDP-4-amino-4,6-dideoxygalactose transaminase